MMYIVENSGDIKINMTRNRENGFRVNGIEVSIIDWETEADFLNCLLLVTDRKEDLGGRLGKKSKLNISSFQ